MEQMLGIQPLAAGFREVAIRPELLDLKWARGSEPTPNGNISAEYEAKNGLQGRLSLPHDVRAFLSLPVRPGQTSVVINGSSTRGIPSESGSRLVVVLSHAGVFDFQTEGN